MSNKTITMDFKEYTDLLDEFYKLKDSKMCVIKITQVFYDGDIVNNYEITGPEEIKVLIEREFFVYKEMDITRIKRENDKLKQEMESLSKKLSWRFWK